MANVIANVANESSSTKGTWGYALIAPLVLAPVLLLVPRNSGSLMASFTGSLLILALSVSAYTDARWRRIPNWVSYGGLLWMLGLNGMMSIGAATAPGSELIGPLGTIGFTTSLAGAAICFAVMFVLYVFQLAGAGDVKLAAVIGAALGTHLAIQALIWTYLVAGLLVGMYLIASYLSRRMRAARAPASETTNVSAPRAVKGLQESVPLAVFLAFGTVIALLQEFGT